MMGSRHACKETSKYDIQKQKCLQGGRHEITSYIHIFASSLMWLWSWRDRIVREYIMNHGKELYEVLLWVMWNWQRVWNTRVRWPCLYFKNIILDLNCSWLILICGCPVSLTGFLHLCYFKSLSHLIQGSLARRVSLLVIWNQGDHSSPSGDLVKSEDSFDCQGLEIVTGT